jgi:hypothetical protein
LNARSRGLRVIDLFGLNIEEVRILFPELFQWLLERVHPQRTAKAGATKDASEYAEKWWLFGKPRPELRRALKGLTRFIATVETSKHRIFSFIDSSNLADNKLVCIALQDSYYLGVLSSRIHVTEALASGGKLGVGNDPVYVKTKCFDIFPFPVCSNEQKTLIRGFGESLDAHRKRQQALHPDLTLTGMYNVMEKLRSGEPLNAKEKVIHEQGLVSILQQIHDDLDAALFDAYGWPHDLTDEQILERLVALNAERAEEERNGLVRWLRPDFQNPEGTRQETQGSLPGTESPEEEAGTAAPSVAAWPKKLPEQVAAVRDLLLGGRAWSIEQVAKSFKGAKRRDVEGVLDSLAALGIAVTYETPQGKRWRGVERGTVAA